MVIQRSRFERDGLAQGMMGRGALKNRTENSNSIGMRQSGQNARDVGSLGRTEHGLPGPLPRRAMEPPHPGESKFRLAALTFEHGQ